MLSLSHSLCCFFSIVYTFLLEAYAIFRCLFCCLKWRASCLSALLMHCGCVCLAADNHRWQSSFHFITTTLTTKGYMSCFPIPCRTQLQPIIQHVYMDVSKSYRVEWNYWKATWINSSTVCSWKCFILLGLPIRGGMMVNACWQRFTHFVLSLMALCGGLAVNFILSMFETACDC